MIFADYDLNPRKIEKYMIIWKHNVDVLRISDSEEEDIVPDEEEEG